MPITAKPTLTETVYLYRGRNEREIEVEATYTFDADGYVQIVDAIDRTEGCELTDREFEQVEDQLARDADAAYAEWLADYGEYLRDCQIDRVAA